MSAHQKIRRLHTPVITEDDRAAVAAVLREPESGANVVLDLERALCDLTGYPYAVACASGTTGLIAAIKATMDFRRGSRMFVPALTFSATWNAVRIAGYQPAMMDVYRGAWTMQEGATFSNAVPVAFNGIDMSGAREIWKRGVIDAACALAPNMRHCYDLPSVVSFNSSKTITGLGGGAVLCVDDEEASLVRFLIDQGKVAGDATEPGRDGFNGRITYMSAALVRSQLRRFDEIAARKRALIAVYRRRLSGVQWQEPGPPPVPWLAMPKFADAPTARRVLAHLNAHGVQARRMYQVPSWEPASAFPVAREIAATALQLPMGLDLTEDDVSAICDLVTEVM